MKNKSIFSEIWDYLKERKAWWLLPIVVTLGIGGLLVVFTQSSVLSPFIYVLF